MGSNKFDDSGMTDLSKNIMIMSFISLLMIIIFVVLVHFYSKSRVLQATEDHNNRVYEQQGLDASFLKTIRVIQFDPKDFKEGIECAVCLSDIEEGETARILPKCDHGFHVECIDMWFHSHSTCPICRNPIVDQTDIELDQQEESTNVLLVEDEANNDHQASSSEQASSSSSLSTYKNRERPHLVIDIPPREVIVEEDEKTPVSSSRMRSLKRILSNSARFNPFSTAS